MTTHPEDAMTRERALEEAAKVADKFAENMARARDTACANGREIVASHRESDIETARSIASGIRALASAQQEPAPAADAEEVVESIAFNLARDIRAAPSLMKATYLAERAISAALRRCAGDSGVTDWKSLFTQAEEQKNFWRERSETVEADRDTWRRVAEKLEAEKQQGTPQ
jgi:hypothetical protein